MDSDRKNVHQMLWAFLFGQINGGLRSDTTTETAAEQAEMETTAAALT
jgi:hypothetical protein